MPRAPEFTANLSGTYTINGVANGDLALTARVYYTSKVYFDYAALWPQKAYATVGVGAEWTDSSDRYTLRLTGSNVTDTKYYGGAYLSAYGVHGTFGPPALWEGSIRVKF